MTEEPPALPVVPLAVLCPRCGQMMEYRETWTAPAFEVVAVCRQDTLAFRLRASLADATAIPYEEPMS